MRKRLAIASFPTILLPPLCKARRLSWTRRASLCRLTSFPPCLRFSRRNPETARGPIPLITSRILQLRCHTKPRMWSYIYTHPDRQAIPNQSRFRRLSRCSGFVPVRIHLRPDVRVLSSVMYADTIRRARDRKVRYGGMALPTFHAMGLSIQIVYPLASSQPIALYAPQWPAPPVVPNTRNTLEFSKLMQCNGLISTPAFLEVRLRSSQSVPMFIQELVTGLGTRQQCNGVLEESQSACTYGYIFLNISHGASVQVFGGGPLSTKTGDKLVNAGIPLVTAYGGTEFGAPTLAYPDDQSVDSPIKPNKDWMWLRFMDTPNIRWVPEGDGTYELHIIVRRTRWMSYQS